MHTQKLQNNCVVLVWCHWESDQSFSLCWNFWKLKKCVYHADLDFPKDNRSRVWQIPSQVLWKGAQDPLRSFKEGTRLSEENPRLVNSDCPCPQNGLWLHTHAEQFLQTEFTKSSVLGVAGAWRGFLQKSCQYNYMIILSIGWSSNMTLPSFLSSWCKVWGQLQS